MCVESGAEKPTSNVKETKAKKIRGEERGWQQRYLQT